jgi:hypothetical protein
MSWSRNPFGLDKNQLLPMAAAGIAQTVVPLGLTGNTTLLPTRITAVAVSTNLTASQGQNGLPIYTRGNRDGAMRYGSYMAMDVADTSDTSRNNLVFFYGPYSNSNLTASPGAELDNPAVAPTVTGIAGITGPGVED